MKYFIAWQWKCLLHIIWNMTLLMKLLLWSRCHAMWKSRGIQKPSGRHSGHFYMYQVRSSYILNAVLVKQNISHCSITYAVTDWPTDLLFLTDYKLFVCPTQWINSRLFKNCEGYKTPVQATEHVRQFYTCWILFSTKIAFHFYECAFLNSLRCFASHTHHN